MSTKGAERRLNLLTDDWVLVSPHRLSRPWQGAISAPNRSMAIHHDPACYLCPGSTRAGGIRNPDYAGTHVFGNDFPALLPERAEARTESDNLLVSEPEPGICRVICYSPDHSRSLSQLPAPALREVVDVWVAQTEELAKRPDVGAVTIFENRGAMMGASNPHPHGQVWATKSVPGVLGAEEVRQATWHKERGEHLLSAYLKRELEAQERIVVTNETFVVLVPYWASWPFETIVIPRVPVPSLSGLDNGQREGLAEIVGRVTACYDALFETEFPYSMGIHQKLRPAPQDDPFVLHMHFYPPLLRSASIRKFMVGFEMFAMAQRDLTPEEAASRLRAVL